MSPFLQAFGGPSLAVFNDENCKFAREGKRAFVYITCRLLLQMGLYLFISVFTLLPISCVAIQYTASSFTSLPPLVTILLRPAKPTCFYTTSTAVSSSPASCPQATFPTSSTPPKTPSKAETSSNPYRTTSSNPSGTTSFQPASSSVTYSPESPLPRHKF